MTSEKVQPDTFKLPHHKLKQHIEVRLTALLKEYDPQFTQDESSIGTTPLTEMTIDTGNSELVSQKPYSIAMKHYQWVKNEINKLLMAKVIWGSQPSWSAPIIVVPKGDEGKCLVIDYCILNKVTTKFICQIPKVEELMTGVLKDFTVTITYLDDIIIFSRIAEEHLSHIKQVFEKLRNAHLSIKLSKCNFFTKEIQYLRYIPSTKGIRPLPSKTQMINNMHPPKTAKHVNIFLGLVRYYRKCTGTCQECQTTNTLNSPERFNLTPCKWQKHQNDHLTK